MLSESLSNVLSKVFSYAIRIPDRLLEVAWRTVMAVAPLHSNVPIDVKSLSTWNVLPYHSAEVPEEHWAELLLACHKYQTAVKDKRWEEVKNNMDEIKSSTIKYITEEVDLRCIPSHSWLMLKTVISLFQFIKAQQSIRESFRALEDLHAELQRRDQEKGTEKVIED